MVNVWFDPRFTATVPDGEMLPLAPAVAVIVGLIVWLSALDVLLEKLLEPPVYSAVMLLCKPTVRLEVDDVKGDVLNVVPPHRAGDIAQKTGLITTNNRWCDVDWRTMESKAVKGVHVLGDATLSAPAMPKSASMANNHAKIAAAAIVELLNGRNPAPLKIINTCYSFVSQIEAIRVSSVHEWEPGQGTLTAVKGAGGVSAARSEAEANYAWNWARTIWTDSLA